MLFPLLGRPVRPSSLFFLSFLLEILEPTGSSFLILFLRRFKLVTFIFFCIDYLALDICSSRFFRLSSHLFDRFTILRALHRFRHFLFQLLPFASHFFILFKENSSNNTVQVFSSESIVGGRYPQRDTSDWAGVVLCGLEDGRP